MYNDIDTIKEHAAELKENDQYWQDVVEGLHEQIRDLEREIKLLNRELDEALDSGRDPFY